MGDSRLGLVMVHGIMSGPKVWEPLRGLIAADRDLGFVEPLAFEYATGLLPLHPLRVFPSLDTVADSLKEYLATEAGAFDRLLLLTHSQGGLVAQRYLARMLQDGRGAELARIQRLVMIACPSNGSELLLSLRRRALGRRHPQEKDLRPLSDQVGATLRTVLRDVVHATEVTERTCPIPVSVYAGESDGVVSRASAQSVFPDASALPGDHSSILKADSPRHRTFTALRRLLLATPHEPSASGTGPPNPFPPPSTPWTPPDAPASGRAEPDRKRRRRTVTVAAVAALAVAVPVLLFAPLPWRSTADGLAPSGLSSPDPVLPPDDSTPLAEPTDTGPADPKPKQNGVTPPGRFPAGTAFWLVDINLDGKADYVAVGKDQKFQFWWNGGIKGKDLLYGEKGHNSYTPDPGADGDALRFGDIDGDTWPDCLVADRTGRVSVRTWVEGAPGGARMCAKKRDAVADVFTEGSTGSRLDIKKTTQIQFADLNGDKRVDHLLVDKDGTVQVRYNQGFKTEHGRTFLDWSPPQQIGWPLQSPHPLKFADINGDGYADQILITPHGGARAWINKGYEASQHPFDMGRFMKDTGAPAERIQFVDVDGDHKADLVYIDRKGGVHVQLNTSTENDFATYHA
ncbi:FG-GAP-like repeat-containing protein [Streptomyces sp. NPDC014733]|uniref:FG-GAP-like repeat-containing protein n=1 Tax=Streptomyces sp. NPDC014733 TaxID=3364885 RepID=UPI0036F91EFE